MSALHSHFSQGTRLLLEKTVNDEIRKEVEDGNDDGTKN